MMSVTATAPMRAILRKAQSRCRKLKVELSSPGPEVESKREYTLPGFPSGILPADAKILPPPPLRASHGEILHHL
jgi:hypothetical protein